ncbi:MAG: putative type transporter [Candidatus Saccharibacteria bacterium]|nr:putative type transporter [Candidatus Saccharibacteria bacterium]
MKRYFKTVWSLAMYFSRRFFRDGVALFFTFLFPLIFLLVFGALNRGSGNISFDIALLNHSNTDFSHSFVEQVKKEKVVKVKEKITSIDEAKELMGRGEIDTILELPPDFGKTNEQGIPSGKMIVYYEEGSPQSGQTFASIMQSVAKGINSKFVSQPEPITVQAQSTKTANLSSFDYVFAGLIGFSILSIGIFGMANGFAADKKTGVLRRLRVSPINASQLILGTALHYLFIGLMTVALMTIVALIIFNFNMRGDYFTYTIFSGLSIILMFGFGLAIAGWAKNENQSAPLSNLIAFPLMFLSGVFFPRFLMPEWLQGFSALLPLSPIVDGLRLITTEGRTLFELGPQLLPIAIWTVLIYLLAFRIFRWE